MNLDLMSSVLVALVRADSRYRVTFAAASSRLPRAIWNFEKCMENQL